MEKLLMFLVICVFAKATEIRNHPKLVRAFEKYVREDPEPEWEEGSACQLGDDERHALTEEAKCGTPKKVLHSFANETRAAHEEIYPEAVWIKKCGGVCSDYGTQYECSPRRSFMRHIPIKKVNTKTSKESCATFLVQEHEECHCTEIGTGNPAVPWEPYVKSKVAVF